MKFLKYYNINWEAGKCYIIQNNSRWVKKGLITVHVDRVHKQCLEFTTVAPTSPMRSFMLRKSDFGALGNWEMVEQI
jgi:hypothetical protein